MCTIVIVTEQENNMYTSEAKKRIDKLLKQGKELNKRVRDSK